MSDLGRRVATALVLAPLALGAVALGGGAFAAFVLLLVVLALRELFALVRSAGANPYEPLGMVVAALIVGAAFWPPLALVALIGVLGLPAIELGRKRPQPLIDAAAGVLGLGYVAVPGALLLHLRLAPVETVGVVGAAWLTVAALVAVWGADVLAYFTGRAIGRTKLLPRVSPKKTVEGLVGGAVGAVLLTVAFQQTVLPFLSVPDAVALGLIAGLIGPVGDLTASLFKRSVDAKDSGTLLPGHGGVLDRIDAMLMAVPVMVLYLALATPVL